MYFLADFNRKINLSHITGAKTSFGVMREGVKRSRDALADLAKRGGRTHEGAYIINNSGKVGQYVKGVERSVQSRALMKAQPKTMVSVLHNHPRNTTLSWTDIANTTPTRKEKVDEYISRNIPAVQVVNTTPNGSYYRAYAKKELNPSMLKRDRQRMLDTVDYEFRKLKPGKLSEKDLVRRSFIAGHLANRQLAQKGLIHYRARMTPKDKRTLDFWLQQAPKLKSIYDGN